MLVLSRRPGEKILFPGLGVSVEVLRSRGSVVRLGIEAPDEITITRSEIESQPGRSQDRLNTPDKISNHELRNQLNLLTLKLELLRRQLEVGQATEPDQTLEETISGLSALEQKIGDRQVGIQEMNGIRVLIVEDQAAERELLANCLRLTGMNVATVGDGASALEYLLNQELPELVLLDMRMPGIDGPTLLEAIRKDERLRTVRVFAVSGSSKTEFASTSLAVDGWFSKPVRVDALLHAANLCHTSANASV